MVHEFTATITGIDVDSDADVDRLYEAGCDDATIGRQDGRTTCTFAREADSYEDAVASAKADIEKAGGTVVSIEREE